VSRYEEAGVNIKKGEEAVERIKAHLRSTFVPGVVGDVGAFAGAFRVPGADGQILLSSIDGVGTKLKVAILCDRHDTVGYDLVCHSANDILVHGGRPLFFLDYVAMGVLEPERVEQLVAGLARGCREVGCALIGGETAEMPGLYAAGDYDLAGFSVGAVERDALLPRGVAAGDVVLGLTSSGLHSNGYSLARKVVEQSGLAWDAPCPFASMTLGDAMLAPTRIYVRSCLAAIRETGGVKALAHITGGGFTENIPRVLPEGLGVRVDLARVPFTPLFRWLAVTGGIAEQEMLRTFNCGVGMVVVVAAEKADAAVDVFRREGETVARLGEVVTASADARVVYDNHLAA
jgi:phosphoribosylformylglycinamidine cyclo-ligase